jgi:hypothetical protein
MRYFCDAFSSKVGQYTEEEFETAFGQFKATSKPLIYTYFKDTMISTGSLDEEDIISLVNFRRKLKNWEHFYTVYETIEYLKLKFDQQLNKLEASGAFTQQIGNRVLALWKSDGYWYSGTVTEINQNRFYIKFDDGHQQWLTDEEIIPLEYRVVDAVECNCKGLSLYYPAHIIAIQGDNNITVQYEHYDGPANGPSSAEKEQTNMVRLRVSR